MQVTLPWPPKQLQAHAKGHWRPKHSATKAYRTTAFWLAKAARLQPNPRAEIRVEYRPPARWRYDCHSFHQRIKPAIDGIADAMGCDDNGFRVHWPAEFGPVVKDGAVIITIGGE